MTAIMQTTSFKPVTVTQTPALYIDANNSSSYSGTGTTITDLSGNGYTQNLGSATQFTTLSGVKCFDCNTYIITAASAAPTLPTTGFTYLCWARMKSINADWRTLYRSSPNDHGLLIQNNANNLGMYDNTLNTFYPSGYSVAGLENIWVFYAVTGDSSGQTFYINGQNAGTTPQSAAGNSHYWLGGTSTGAQNFGYIANMRLYTSILPQQVIQQIYGTSKYTFG